MAGEDAGPPSCSCPHLRHCVVIEPFEEELDRNRPDCRLRGGDCCHPGAGHADSSRCKALAGRASGSGAICPSARRMAGTRDAAGAARIAAAEVGGEREGSSGVVDCGRNPRSVGRFGDCSGHPFAALAASYPKSAAAPKRASPGGAARHPARCLSATSSAWKLRCSQATDVNRADGPRKRTTVSLAVSGPTGFRS